MYYLLNYFKKFINGIILIFNSTIQTGKYKIGTYILLRFILDIFFVYFVNVVKFKKIKRKFYNYYNNKFAITSNWFGNNAQIWFFFFSKLKLINKNINILEIGSFEGLSIIFYYKFLKKINVTSVDFLNKKKSIF